MSARTYLLLMLVLSFLQGTVLPGVFLEGVPTLLLSLSLPLQSFLPAAFLAGLLFDLVQAQTLGTSSLIFVLGGFMVFFLGDKIPVKHPFFGFLFIGVFNFARSAAISAAFPLAATVIAGGVLAIVLKRLGEFSGKIKL